MFGAGENEIEIWAAQFHFDRPAAQDGPGGRFPKMSGWKFIAEFRRGRKEPVTLECFVAIANLEQARLAAATKLVGADVITEERISKAELFRRDVRKGDAVIR